MGGPGELSPRDARDAAAFVELMRRLKERSGLTYRELEERAARRGDVLARSTLADVLRRGSLPRADVVAAFVRACGDERTDGGGRWVDAWLEVRARLAEEVEAVPAGDAAAVSVAAPSAEAIETAESADTADTVESAETAAQSPPEATGATESGPSRTKVRLVTLTAALMVPLIASVIWVLLPGSSGAGDASSSGAPTVTASTAPAAPVDGWATIRPARAPALCMTDGRDRGGAYGSAVAVQLPCAKATVPRTYLEPAGEGLYRIQWHHPQMGKGCLTVVGDGPVKGMLEPRNDCAQATLFRLEAIAADSADGFLIRPADSGRCVGIADSVAAEGAEAVEQRCTGAIGQRFLIRRG
ncbi:XRE family transcriptional regulator [Streptomyces sp. NPDC050617]|uniref:XRE family transcriptional regulator n=1 Tax=Streptomyces sp. NPDC050617 TaxID=3154628 RepID=UPI00341A4C4D